MEQTIGQRLKWHLILFLSSHLPPCKVMVELFSEARERPLKVREKIVTKLHLFTCEACQRYINQIEKMSDSVKPQDEEAAVEKIPKMSDEARQRIKATLEAATQRKD